MVDFEFRPFSQLPTVVKVLILLLVANSHGMTCWNVTETPGAFIDQMFVSLFVYYNFRSIIWRGIDNSGSRK